MSNLLIGTLGTFRTFIDGANRIHVFTMDQRTGETLALIYASDELPNEYLDELYCNEYYHTIGYGAIAPEDVEEHFGLELGSEILLGFYRACEGQYNAMRVLTFEAIEWDRVDLAFQMMERAHDALAMTLAKRKLQQG